jgi:argininosuccinate lyase
MIVEDLWGSIAHVSMLGRQGVIPAKDAGQIVSTLKRFQDDRIAGKLDFFDPKFAMHDDVHMNMEARAIDALGMNVAGRMHTTRSRNDQVPVSSQLRTRNRMLEMRRKVVGCVQAFMDRAREPGAMEAVMPGYTHFQHAQPISISFWMSHYAAALLRDLERLEQAYNFVDENPLGAGAISGTSFPIDRQLTTKLLGFQKVRLHALDATGHRDWMLDVLNANATIHSTWSRLAEELIMWSSYEFRTVTIDDGFAMGSSMMPQKKNPGTLELLRGRTGMVTGYAMGGYTMLHGLPSGYNRDFHEEKELLFASMTMAIRAAEIVPALVESTTFNKDRMRELCDKNFMVATELANYLVAKHDIPFRETHHIVGSLVGKLVAKGDNMTNLGLVMEHLKEKGIDAKLEDVLPYVDPDRIVATYNSEGGTGPKAMQQTLAHMDNRLASLTATLDADEARVSNAFKACQEIGDKGAAVQTVDDLAQIISGAMSTHCK